MFINYKIEIYVVGLVAHFNLSTASFKCIRYCVGQKFNFVCG